jgi:adenylate cyclase
VSETEQNSGLSGFFNELKRRRVIRVVVLYTIAGWIVIEVASTVIPGLNLPEWTVTLVITLVALGFVIAVMLAWAFDIGPGGVHKTAPAEEPPAPDQPAAEPAAETALKSAKLVETTADADDRKTIAVLPFINMSGDADNEYFSDGISEEILNLLVKLPKLKVSSRTSSFAFKGKDFDIPEVAQRLGVSTVLEGSVRRAGDRVRITAQLIETESDSHLWSETYDRELKDVFGIQDDIAQSIVDALQVTLTPMERRSIQYVATSDAAAYDYYLRGRKYFYAMTAKDFQHAIGMYERAIAQDANYALAYAGIADTHSNIYRYADATPQHAAKALEASQKAIELDPDSAEARVSRGLALFINEEYDEAETQFEKSSRLNPNLFESYYFYALGCAAQGDFEKAVKLFKRASEVNPADYQSPTFLRQALTSLGRHEDAMVAGMRAYEVIRKHLDMHPDDSRALYLGAGALSALGQRDKALEWAERALESGRDEPMVLYNVACTFAKIGNKDKSIDLLTRAVDLGWGDRAWMETDSALDNLRDDERFKTLLARLDG